MAETSTERRSLTADTHGGDSGGETELTQGKCCKINERNDREQTVMVEMEGEDTAMELMRCVRELCGGLLACRQITEKKYEMTMSHPKGKDRLMEGFKIGENRVHVRELINDELVVSFMNLPFYIEDREILAKLQLWGVSAVSPIKRRMWPGTNVADGTRFLKVKFNNEIQSLPYSARFDTALGAEYFRVLHDKQVKVCRLCIKPGHIMRECPEFHCNRCGVQGHYARECTQGKKRCELCQNLMSECRCNKSEAEDDTNESGQESESGGSEEGEAEYMESEEEGVRKEMEETEKEDAGKQEGERPTEETEGGKKDGANRKERKERTKGNNEEEDAGRRRGALAREVRTEGTADRRSDGVEKKGPKTKETRGPEKGATVERQDGKEEAGPGRTRREDDTGRTENALSGAKPTETAEETTTPQTVGSETDMDIEEQMKQLRKRQNTKRHTRNNKKSKTKEITK